MPSYSRALLIAVVLAMCACKGESGGPPVDGPRERDVALDGPSAQKDSATDADQAGVRDTTVDTTPPQCNGATATTATPGPAPPAAPAVTLPQGFSIESIAAIPSARQLAALTNGDLLVGTSGEAVYLIPNAEADGRPGAPVVFATVADSPVQGVAFARSTCTVYIASQHGIYSARYADGQTSAQLGQAIAKVRQVTAGGHTSTSVAFASGTLYAGVGSSCNACTENDPTRATVQRLDPDGANMATRATRIRNPIALAVNPATGTVWAGVAGQDGLPVGHPYEFFDAVTAHPGVADYGWPACEENQQAYIAGSDCSKTVVPRVVLPAYSTIIGAAFYPSAQAGKHAFPQTYRGGVFLTAHGAWHKVNGKFFSPPRVAYVAMNGDAPKIAVDWSDPSKQWTEFVGGFQRADGITRVGRPAGIAVGREGSLFIADDQAGLVYRIRPN